MELKAVSEVTRTTLETDAERAWAESMGTDYRRAWDTAPSVGVLCFLAAALATTEGYRHFVAALLGVLGGDGSQLDTLHDALHANSVPRRSAALALLTGLPGLQQPESELVDLVRAQVTYDSLRADLVSEI